MSLARRKDDELVQQMYKYSKALTDMVATGWITRERLGAYMDAHAIERTEIDLSE